MEEKEQRETKKQRGKKWGEGRDRSCHFERETEKEELRLEDENQLASMDWGGSGRGLSLKGTGRILQQ